MQFVWKKVGRVFDPSSNHGREFIKEFAQAPATLVFDDFVRIYFSCRPGPDSKGQYMSYSSYLDVERNDLIKIREIAEKPILSLGGLGSFDEFGTYPVSVIQIEQSKYRAYYAGWTRCESVPFNTAIGIAESIDQGKTFNRLGPGPVISYSVDEPFVMSGPKIRRFNDKYYLFYIAGSKWILDNGKPEPVYKIRLAISDDGLKWEKLNRNLIPWRIEVDEAQASPDVFFHNGRYHMFFCYRYSTDYRNGKRGYRIGYAHSVDLLNWIREDDKAGIDVSENGWDSEMVSYPHILKLDGSIYMFYLGNQVGRNGFGLAKLEEI